jgi:hypothetical protein
MKLSVLPSLILYIVLKRRQVQYLGDNAIDMRRH